jgi:hypothetical protein
MIEMSRLDLKEMNDWHLKTSQNSEKMGEVEESDNKSILRNIKIDLLLGNISLTPMSSRIDSVVWEKCQLLTSKGFIIGGSIALKVYGLLDRSTDDFDIFKEDFTFSENMVMVNHYEGDSNILRTKLHTDMGDMDIFKTKVSYVLFDGVKLSDPLPAYEAKLRYNRKKDRYDFLVLEQKHKMMLNKEKYLFL